MEKLLKEATLETTNETCRGFLKAIPLFAELDDEAISSVLENAVIRHYDKGKLLFLTGDNAEFFYIIIKGWIKLYRETRDGRESVISVLTHGDVFGRTAILKKGTFAYTAEAIENSSVLQIPASYMLYMAEHHSQFDDFLAKFLESELNELNQHCLESERLAHMTSAQRVGCFLLKMCGEQREGDITLQLPYEKSLVAGRLGMTPETFSRSLNQLTAIGVETNNALVTIHNIAQLQARVCEHCSALQKECVFSNDD